MVRPIDESKYLIGGKPCKHHPHETKRYANTKQCVACVAEWNAASAARRRGGPPKATRSKYGYVITPKNFLVRERPMKVADAVGAYRRTPAALERSAYLDRKVREHFGLDSKSDSAKTVTGGDLYRATLPVGGQHLENVIREQQTVAARHIKEVEDVRAVLRDLDLPDIVSVQEIMAMLPGDLVAALETRIYVATAKALRKEFPGTMTYEVGASHDASLRRLFVIKNQEVHGRNHALLERAWHLMHGRKVPARLLTLRPRRRRSPLSPETRAKLSAAMFKRHADARARKLADQDSALPEIASTKQTSCYEQPVTS